MVPIWGVRRKSAARLRFSCILSVGFAVFLVDRARRGANARGARADGGRERAGLSPPGSALRRRPGLLGDGQLRRAPPRQRTDARLPPDRERRASPRRPDLRLGAVSDGRGGPAGRGCRSGHRRHQLRLPRAQGDEDGCRRDAARGPGAGGADRRRRRGRCRRPGLGEDAPRSRGRLADMPRRRAATRRCGRSHLDPAPPLGETDVHRHCRPLADRGTRQAGRRARDRLRRRHLAGNGAGAARDHGSGGGHGRPRRAGQPVGAPGDHRGRGAASRHARRSPRS